jgi:hypothetical protein
VAWEEVADLAEEDSVVVGAVVSVVLGEEVLAAVVQGDIGKQFHVSPVPEFF